MFPGSNARFVVGVPLIPAAGLLAWFEAQRLSREPRLTRVPLVLKRGVVGFSPRGVRIGAHPDALEVFISDAALGVGLALRAIKWEGDTCAFLVEGYWRGVEDGAYHYQVCRAGRPLSTAELAAIADAEVEGESGN